MFTLDINHYENPVADAFIQKHTYISYTVANIICITNHGTVQMEPKIPKVVGEIYEIFFFDFLSGSCNVERNL